MCSNFSKQPISTPISTVFLARRQAPFVEAANLTKQLFFSCTAPPAGSNVGEPTPEYPYVCDDFSSCVQEVEHRPCLVVANGFHVCQNNYECKDVPGNSVIFDCFQFKCSDGQDEYTCVENSIDFGCGFSFLCKQTSFKCQSDHIFACFESHSCEQFNCSAKGTMSPCGENGVQYSRDEGSDTTAGDFICGESLLANLSKFQCKTGFTCDSGDDFECIGMFQCSTSNVTCGSNTKYHCKNTVLCPSSATPYACINTPVKAESGESEFSNKVEIAGYGERKTLPSLKELMGE